MAFGLSNPTPALSRKPNPGTGEGGGGGGPARVLDSLSLSPYTGGVHTFTLVGNAVNGETTKVRFYSGSAPTTKEQVDAGTWPGATVVQASSFLWADPADPIAAVDGIPRGMYRATAVVNNGEISNFVISNEVEIDTLDTSLNTVSFAGNTTGGINYAFTPNEASKASGVRVSAWAAGTDPSETAIKLGTGAIDFDLGTGVAATPFTGTLQTGAGEFQVGVYYLDEYDNELFYLMPGTVNVAVPTGPTLSLVTSQAGTTNTGTKTGDLTGVLNGDTLVIAVATVGGLPTNTITSMTVQGFTATYRGRTPTDRGLNAEIWSVVMGADGTAGATIQINRATANNNQMAVFKVNGTVTNWVVASDGQNNSTASLSEGIATTAYGMLLACGTCDDGPRTPAWTGATQVLELVGVASRSTAFATHLVTVDESPRNITYDPTPISGSAGSGLVLLAIS
jgi:hypothetical protein